MRRVESLLASMVVLVPSAAARHHDWFAFVQEGVSIVGHGSITLEELIVPFIHVER